MAAVTYKPKPKTGFAAGTFVYTESGLTPIQHIKVGDAVLTRPEQGEWIAGYKPVTKVFKHKNQPLWLLIAIEHWDFNKEADAKFDTNKYRWTADKVELLVSANHAFWVVGKVVKWKNQVLSETTIMYPQPYWKRVDQLDSYEMIMDAQGKFFCVDRAQPLYQFSTATDMEVTPNYMWYEYHYHNEYDENDYTEVTYTEDDFYNEGRVLDIDVYHQWGNLGAYVRNNKGCLSPRNHCKEDGKFVPFTDTLYNLEVEDDHTYFVSKSGVWVHNSRRLTLNDNLLMAMAENV